MADTLQMFLCPPEEAREDETKRDLSVNERALALSVATLMPELKRTGKKLGVVSMCIGTGMGAAAVIEAES